jgi:2-polyprenyl-6-methoxyphenol hydroxylase-like FAD-dependent oxidoreductase
MIGPDKTALPVLVVGAGPTGLMMAGELARFGVPCRLIDKAPHASLVSKALAVQSRTLECFARIGLDERAVAAGHPVHGLNAFSDGKRIVHVSLDSINSPYPFVLVVSQQETERLLLENAERLGVTVERQVELLRLTPTEQGTLAVLRHIIGQREERVVVPWVIGCDGAHSVVRHEAGISFSGSAFPEAFALADVTLEGSIPDDEFTLYLAHGDVVALIPMTGNRAFRIVIEHHSAEEHDSEPTLEEFRRALERCGRPDLRPSNPVWMARFRISQRLVSRYNKGPIFLAGDAAHIHSPVGGQGMNTGIQDACNLAWKLALVIHGRGRPEILESYDKERHPIGQTLLRTTGGVFNVILWRNPVAAAVRDRVASLLTSFEAVQERIRQGISEIGINYRHSPIVAEQAPSLVGRFAGWLSFHLGPRAGDRAVDASLTKQADGSTVRLFDLLAAPRHTLLLFSGWRGRSKDSERRQELLEMIGRDFGDQIRLFVIGSESEQHQRSKGAEVLLDPSGDAHRAYGADDEMLYLIRPDGYVGYRGRSPQKDKLLEYLKRILV